MPNPAERNIKYVFLVVFVFGLDQLVKWLVLHYITLHDQINIIPHFFDLTLRFNSGAAFSFLADAGGWQKYLFLTLAIAVCVFFSYEISKNKFAKLGKIAASFIMGGALGNAFDRLIHTQDPYHGVVDFLLFYYQNWAYPAFNIADSFICIGAVLLIWDSIQSKKKIS
ncbi:signal peptidase II [Neisseria sp. Ec49-e6-T10]|uniref:signal peptidase II n=1 Tax=Neisseria sp. Ec49-e6-T10 TaxID=3140744 RepID=UPI003EBEFD9B